jgi:hypothetical protein
MSKERLHNPQNIEITDHTYYSVQYGLVIMMAYHNAGVWYMTGQPEIKQSDLKFDLIIVQKVCTHAELVNGLVVTVEEKEA